MSDITLQLFEHLIVDYRPDAIKTESPAERVWGSGSMIVSGSQENWRGCRMMHAMLGFLSEIPELEATMNLVRTTPAHLENRLEELGDMMWYLALLADAAQLHTWYKASALEADHIPNLLRFCTDHIWANTPLGHQTPDVAKDLYRYGASLADVIKARVFYKRDLFKWPTPQLLRPFEVIVAGHILAILNRLVYSSIRVISDAKDGAVLIYFNEFPLWAALMATNIEKLKTRYPEAFSEDRANNRDLAAEQKVLAVT